MITWWTQNSLSRLVNRLRWRSCCYRPVFCQIRYWPILSHLRGIFLTPFFIFLTIILQKESFLDLLTIAFYLLIFLVNIHFYFFVSFLFRTLRYWCQIKIHLFHQCIYFSVLSCCNRFVDYFFYLLFKRLKCLFW